MSEHQRLRAALVAAVGSLILVFSAAAQPVGSTSGTRSSDPTNGKQSARLVVPLPGAALAGLGTLAGVIGLSVLRRRRHEKR